MPELPDIELYRVRLLERLVGDRLERMRFCSPFVLRSVEPLPADLEGRVVLAVRRLGKRLVLDLEGDLHVVIHLMIAGRLQWLSPPPSEKRAVGRILLASFTFARGRLDLVEASSKKRASIHLARGAAGLAEHRRSGLDIFSASASAFAERVRAQNRTLKRTLTDPNCFDGIGNAYSDEILFAARLSPVRLTQALTDDEVAGLHEAAISTLEEWRKRLAEVYTGFPTANDITAFRPDFAVHGRYGKPCPACGSPVQRIVYAEHETNYCARCQNFGRLLADRSLSRLLKSDWPKTLEDTEA